eukprot:2793163-Rhodomonas_salina.2
MLLFSVGPLVVDVIGGEESADLGRVVFSSSVAAHRHGPRANFSTRFGHQASDSCSGLGIVQEDHQETHTFDQEDGSVAVAVDGGVILAHVEHIPLPELSLSSEARIRGCQVVLAHSVGLVAVGTVQVDLGGMCNAYRVWHATDLACHAGEQLEQVVKAAVEHFLIHQGIEIHRSK